MKPGVVIIGAGHAAGQAAASLRQLGYQEPITLIGDEDYAPYQRPPLSKDWLAGETDISAVLFKPEAFWDEHNVRVLTNHTVVALDCTAKRIVCDNGESFEFSYLILATGGRARRMNCAGESLPGVHILRGLGDAIRLSDALHAGRHLTVIGGGYVGLEVAATARKRGLEVSVLEAEARVLARVAGQEISDFFEHTHREHGVKILTNVLANAFIGDDKLTAVRLNDGTELQTDLALVGIGLIPNVELADKAGLVCDNGIVVDELCRTKDPHILAIGDVTRHPNAIYGRDLRLESVHNALEQGKTAAGTIVGREKPYNQVPWFWSDQYDLKLQIAGLSEGYDKTIVRGDPDAKAFAVFYFRDGALIACDAVNAPGEYMAARMMIAKGACPDLKSLVDTTMPMKDIMMQAR